MKQLILHLQQIPFNKNTPPPQEFQSVAVESY